MKKRIAILLSLFLVQDSWGAIAHVQSTACSALSSTVNCAYSSSPAAGNLLIIECTAHNGSGSLSASDNNTNTYAAVGADKNWSILNDFTNVFYAKNSNVGATTVTCSMTSADAVEVTIHEYSGASTTSPFDVTSSSTSAAEIGITHLQPAAVTTAVANELMFAVQVNRQSAYSTASGTVRQSYANNYFHTSEDTLLSTAQSYASSFDLTTSPTFGYVMIQAAFKPPSAATTTNCSSLPLMGIGG